MEFYISEFDWDETNERHIWERHKVTPEEKEVAMKTKAKRRIPDFRSETEEQEFWATHSALDYEMELVEAEVKIDPLARTRLVSLRLPERLIRDLKEIAHSEGLPYQKLIKLCLQKFVELRKAQAQRLLSTR